MPGRETDDIDRLLRVIFEEEWKVDGFGDHHVAVAMRRAYELGRDGVMSEMTHHPART